MDKRKCAIDLTSLSLAERKEVLKLIKDFGENITEDLENKIIAETYVHEDFPWLLYDDLERGWVIRSEPYKGYAECVIGQFRNRF